MHTEYGKNGSGYHAAVQKCRLSWMTVESNVVIHPIDQHASLTMGEMA